MSPQRYWLIEPGGEVAAAEWTDPLELGCIPLDKIQQLLGYQAVEVVWVVWQGHRRAMFVDELGLNHSLPPNAKATRIYMNATFRREGLHEFVYEDLAANPMFTAQAEYDRNVQARVLIRSFRSIIVGRALLWEGEVG